MVAPTGGPTGKSNSDLAVLNVSPGGPTSLSNYIRGGYRVTSGSVPDKKIMVESAEVVPPHQSVASTT